MRIEPGPSSSGCPKLVSDGISLVDGTTFPQAEAFLEKISTQMITSDRSFLFTTMKDSSEQTKKAK